MQKMDTKMTPQEYYKKNEPNRGAYEDAAEVLAKLTIPALMRDKSWSSTSNTPDDYAQSYGARLVNNLKSRLGVTLFPHNASAFRFTPSAELLADAKDAGKDNELNRNISKSQNDIAAHLEALNARNSIFAVLEHMIVVSSAVLEKVKNTGYKVHTLRNFVVSLNDRGEEHKICVKEVLNKLPEGIMVQDEKEEYELYTMLEEIEDNVWIMTQEIDGELVGKEQKFTNRTRPFAYQGWIWSQGDYYHRPYCDDYIGDLKAVNTFAKVLTKGALISSKSITMVDERAGRTRLRDVVRAQNGGVIQGRADDVTSYQHGKNYDFQVAQQAMDSLKQELAVTFLMTGGLRRDAERVTAEEIKMISQEAENGLASVYSMISNRLIKRMVYWAMDDLKIKDSELDVNIVTGLDALGKQALASKIDEWVTRGSQIGYIDRIKKGELALLYASLYNIDTESLLMTEEEYKQMQEQQQQALQQQQMQEATAKGAEAQMSNTNPMQGGQ